MAMLGTMNTLKVLSVGPEGAVVDAEGWGELKVPLKELPEGLEAGSTLEVCLYAAHRGEIIATTRRPKGLVGEIVGLKVKQCNDMGAFLDWGLPKDLLLPWGEVPREQQEHVVEGRPVVVAVFEDERGRVTASARLDEFIASEADEMPEGTQVDLVVVGPTPNGVRVVVNNRYFGLVHQSEAFGDLSRGAKRVGYTKRPRFDRKLDLALSAPGYAKVEGFAGQLLDILGRAGGFLPLTDKSPADEVFRRLGVSKKVFKQAVGALYRERRIEITEDGIRTV